MKKSLAEGLDSVIGPRKKRCRIAVASLTRKRPALFAKMLRSLVDLEWPEAAEQIFIFVENDEELTINEEVDAFREAVPKAEVHIANEPKLGIPVARNKVLEIALANQIDFLAFIDDDELVLPDWIGHIWRKAVDDNLDLVGGPLELFKPVSDLSRWQSLTWEFLVQKNNLRVRKANHLELFGRQNEVRIFTNNWLVRMDFVRKSGMRFDESMGLSGGTDTKFYLQSRKLGARTGWAYNALVKDFIPMARLSPMYQFRRARDQNMALFYIDGHYKRPFARIRAATSLLGRLLRGGIKIIFSFAKGGRGMIEALTKIGAGVGHVYGAFGRQSTHYKTVAADKS